jgi:hypothetical protein
MGMTHAHESTMRACPFEKEAFESTMKLKQVTQTKLWSVRDTGGTCVSWVQSLIAINDSWIAIND